jgi:hypothetical protein
MPKRRKESSDSIPADLILPALDIKPEAVYRPEQVRVALALRASSLRREWRAGRLRVVRRCGRNYIIGRDLLRWLDGGELLSPASRQRPSTTAAAG